MAERAGVSVATVSNVLNNRPGAGALTVNRVLEAAAALDYRPDRAARALTARRRHRAGPAAPSDAPKLSCLGYLSVDFTAGLAVMPHRDDRITASRIRKTVGGPAANVAATAAGLGMPYPVEAVLVTVTGDDDDSDWAIDRLAERGVRVTSIGRHRGAGLGGGHDEREQTLNQLLVEMDGFESNEGVILLAATNRADVLDPALLRPGRFDRQVVVDSPDVQGREMILRVHARKLPLEGDVDLQVIAKGTPGLSGADLANICNEAALLAARRDADTVRMEDFEQAKDKIMLGTERRSMVLTENERKLTAYHEAGHAVIGLRVPGLDPIHKVTIVPRGRALGITASLPEEDRHSYTKDWLEGQLCMLFGGRVAEEMTFGPEKVTTGAGNDIERATQMARRMVTRFGMSDAVGLMAIGDSDHQVFLGREMTQKRDISEHTAQLVDQEVKRILDEAHHRARAVLERQEDLLERIAQALLERETLDRTEIGLLDEGKPLPPVEPVEEVDDERTLGSRPESATQETATEADGPPGSGEADEGKPEVRETEADTEPAGERESRESSVPTPTARRARPDPDPDASRG